MTDTCGNQQPQSSTDSEPNLPKVQIVGVKISRSGRRRQHIVRKRTHRPEFTKITTPPLSTSTPPAAEVLPDFEAEVTITGVTTSGKMMRKKQGTRKRSLRPIITQQDSAGPSLLAKTNSLAKTPSSSSVPVSPSPSSKKETDTGKLTGKRKIESSSSTPDDAGKKKTKVQSSPSKPTTRSSASKEKSESMSSGYDVSKAFSHRFFSEKSKLNCETMSQRPILGERNLNFASFKGTGILELLEDQQWLFTTTNPEPYVSEIVYDFYSNLTPEISNSKSPKFQKVYVRGKIFEFNPKKINEYFISSVRCLEIGKELDIEGNLDLVATELTGKPSTWPKKSNLQTTNLTTRYPLLFRIVVFNWIPKVHVSTISPQIASVLYRLGKGVKMDLGNLIFTRIISEINSTVFQPIFGYPSLIFNILMNQHNIKEDGDSLTPLGKPLTISDKLLHGKHVVDIEGDKATGYSSPSPASTSAASADSTSLAGIHITIQKMVVEMSALKAMLYTLMQKLYPNASNFLWLILSNKGGER